ncbi:hypothetical protein BVY04_04305 [bacterium M21]|nr:hypothetical protein BVY04_04305 [bacterium M21]
MLKQVNIALRVTLPLVLLLITGYLVWFFTHLPTMVPAFLETTPVPHASDAAEDPCIWIHPTDPNLSLIFGTDKDGGIGVYDLSGTEIQYLDQGRVNGIDLRYNFPLDDGRITLVVASNRSGQCLDCFRLIPDTRRLLQVGRVDVGGDLQGCSMYFSQPEQSYYCFVTSPLGTVKQYLLQGNRIGDVTGKLVREISFDSRVDACVTDDELGFLYVSEQKEGVWKLFADPGVNDDWRHQVCKVDRFGRVQPDAEGLAIYYGMNRTGYLILSSKGNSTFAIFERNGKNAYVASFGVGSGILEAGTAIDGVSGTDGIDVVNVPLGSNFPQGLLVVQDDYNDGENQNFKLIPWEFVVQGLGDLLKADTSWNPRDIGLSTY